MSITIVDFFPSIFPCDIRCITWNYSAVNTVNTRECNIYLHRTSDALLQITETDDSLLSMTLPELAVSLHEQYSLSIHWHNVLAILKTADLINPN